MSPFQDGSRLFGVITQMFQKLQLFDKILIRKMVRLIENIIQNAHVISSKSLIFFFALNPLAIKSDLCRFPLSLKLSFFFKSTIT